MTTKDQTEELRRQIASLLNAGMTPTQIAAQLDCSRTTIYKVRSLLQDPHQDLQDQRRRNKGRPLLYEEAIWAVILELRTRNPTMGPAMLYHTLCRQASDYGIEPKDVPSPSTIAAFIHHNGLAIKPVGPRDLRTYPDTRPTTPGTFTIDTWGPWHCRAQRLYLVTIQDRFTRAAMLMPVSSLTHGVAPPITAQVWPKAIQLAHLLLEPGSEMERLYTDNGVGMVPAFGILPQGARYALRYGARLIFVPPGQPWRNGRLERFHYTMEREFFRLAFPPSITSALTGLHEWLNYYNADRPHSALNFKAPADLFPWIKRHETAPWEIPEPPRIEPQAGTVEAIRLVNNDGVVDLWQGQVLRISPILAGQYVRVQFAVTGSPSHGRILYNRMKNEEIVVATFNHTLDVPGRSQAEPLVTELVGVDFDTGLIAQNQRLDQSQFDAQQARVAKRPVRFRNDDRR